MISNKHNLKERIGRLRAKSNGDGLVVRNYQDLDNIPTNFKAFKDGLDTWNLYHKIVYDTPTTNNGLEQWNGQYNQNQKGRQTVQKAIRGFRREVSFGEVKCSELSSGTFRISNPGVQDELRRPLTRGTK